MLSSHPPIRMLERLPKVREHLNKCHEELLKDDLSQTRRTVVEGLVAALEREIQNMEAQNTRIQKKGKGRARGA